MYVTIITIDPFLTSLLCTVISNAALRYQVKFFIGGSLIYFPVLLKHVPRSSSQRSFASSTLILSQAGRGSLSASSSKVRVRLGDSARQIRLRKLEESRDEIHQLLTKAKRRGGVSVHAKLVTSYYQTHHLEVCKEVNELRQRWNLT